MKKNIGTLDKGFRIIIAITLISLSALKIITGLLAVGALVLAAVLIITTTFSYCPLYLPFGISTRTSKKDSTLLR